MTDPIDSVVWRDALDLQANYWNPNHVYGPERELLERSILDIGWVFPIVINPNLLIIDGYHRTDVAKSSPKLRKKYGTMIPTVTVDIPDPEAMLTTVRLNRAKGQHVAVRMSDLVKALHDTHGYGVEDIAQGIGGTEKEVKLLLSGGVLKNRKVPDHRYSKEWIPVEVSKAERAAMLERGERSLKPEREDEEAPE